MKPLLALFALSIFPAVSAQSPTPKTQTTAAPYAIEVDEPQWEYIVVSFGKTLFSDIVDAKSTGLSKTVAYSAAGLQLGQEALTTQSQMDTLGRFGWELVTVLGTIGGDQEMLFKRRFDPLRSARESKLIAEEAKVLAARRKTVASDATSLIDLDEVDQNKADSDYQSNAQAKYTEYANKALPGGTAVESVSAAYVGARPNEGKLKISVEIDATASLLKDGNKYRRTEATTLANQVKQSIMESSGLAARFGTETELFVTVLVKYEGKRFPVGAAFGFGQRFTR